MIDDRKISLRYTDAVRRGNTRVKFANLLNNLRTHGSIRDIVGRVAMCAGIVADAAVACGGLLKRKASYLPYPVVMRRVILNPPN